jgi:hypothetical protein
MYELLGALGASSQAGGVVGVGAVDHLAELQARPAAIDGVYEGVARDDESRWYRKAGGGQFTEVCSFASHLRRVIEGDGFEPTNHVHIASSCGEVEGWWIEIEL